jgi:nitroimidazol reductase NimA-like FMN-containing flavoprotein (pyridoxamine 5'-phosphate oxidase superfamily)
MSRTYQRIVELTTQQCLHLLDTHRPRLGRVAFAEDGDPDWPTVLPVNYAYHDGQIFFRTFEGSKLYAALRRQRVAFEIDVVDSAWKEGWSVVALGTLEVVRDPKHRAAVDEILRSWAADRTGQLVRLDIELLTGREIIGAPLEDG